MASKEMGKHTRFLHHYAIKNNIVFRVSRSSIFVESLEENNC